MRNLAVCVFLAGSILTGMSPVNAAESRSLTDRYWEIHNVGYRDRNGEFYKVHSCTEDVISNRDERVSSCFLMYGKIKMAIHANTRLLSCLHTANRHFLENAENCIVSGNAN